MRSLSTRSRIYENYQAYMTINSDGQHSQPWIEKKSPIKKQQKQLVQIDQILHGIIRERMFGNLLNRKRALVENYGDLDQATIECFSSWSANNSAKFGTPKTPSREKPRTALKLARVNKMLTSLDSSGIQFRRRDSRTSNDESPRRRKLSTFVKIQNSSLSQINLSGNPNFPDYFRKISNQPAKAILVECKVSRQQLKALFRGYHINSQILDRFFNYFDIPQHLFYRQYINCMQKLFNNTSLRQIKFLVFQIIDRDHDGFITIGDLLTFLGENDGAGQELEKEMFMLSELIQTKSDNDGKIELPEIEDVINIKTDEMLISNYSIRLDTYRDLVKENNKQLVTCPALKITVYHKTFQAMQHNPDTRMKNQQLEQNEVNRQPKRHERRIAKMERLGLYEYYRIFNRDRPYIFYFIVKQLIGQNLQQSAVN